MPSYDGNSGVADDVTIAFFDDYIPKSDNLPAGTAAAHWH